MGPAEPAARAIEALERGAVGGVRAARALYRRWRTLPSEDRRPLRPLAEELKGMALDLRGRSDRGAADRDLHEAGERLATAMVDRAAADPDVSDIEVHDLRSELARELDRLAEAEIEASRGPGSVSGETAPADGQG